MGSFYGNIALKGADREKVVGALEALERTAYVTPAIDGVTVIYDEEELDLDALGEVAATLARDLGCVALTCLNADDDVLMLKLHDAKGLADEYNSCPAADILSDEPLSDTPTGGDAKKIGSAFGVASRAADIEKILRGEYTFAMDRHGELAKVLGLPACCVSSGFSYVSDDEAPEGVALRDLARVGNLAGPPEDDEAEDEEEDDDEAEDDLDTSPPDDEDLA